MSKTSNQLLKRISNGELENDKPQPPLFSQDLCQFPTMSMISNVLLEAVNTDLDTRSDIIYENYKSDHVPFDQMNFVIYEKAKPVNAMIFHVCFTKDRILIEVYMHIKHKRSSEAFIFGGLYSCILQKEENGDTGLDVSRLLKPHQMFFDMNDKNLVFNKVHVLMTAYLKLASITGGLLVLAGGGGKPENKSSQISSYKFPYNSIIKLKLNERLTVYDQDSKSREYSAKAEHQVRGHWRFVKSLGKDIWVRSHKRGDPALGKIIPTYEVEL